MAYTRDHRFFLRTIMNEGAMERSRAEQVMLTFGDIEVGLYDFIAQINAKIAPFLQQIKITKNDVTGVEEIAFLSLADDEISKNQPFHSAIEFKYFQMVFKEIVKSKIKSITIAAALQLVSKVQLRTVKKVKKSRPRVQVHTITETRALELLQHWCDSRYLRSESVDYKLDTRAIHQFDKDLKEIFSDYLEICFLCKEPVFEFKLCMNCKKVYHKYCLQEKRPTFQTCPNCMSAFESGGATSSQIQPTTSNAGGQ